MRNYISDWLSEMETPNKPNEWEVKELFKKLGLQVPKGHLLKPNMKMNHNLQYPLVIKVCDSSILHKSDVGGVKLKVQQEDYVAAVIELQKRFPGKDLLIEEMVSYKGPECIIGGVTDPVFGPAIMFGAGGILTEIFKDVSFRIAPFSVKQAKLMIGDLKISELFSGYRGIDLDLESLAQIISKVSELVMAIGEDFSQLDINPIVYTPKGWVLLDGVILFENREDN